MRRLLQFPTLFRWATSLSAIVLLLSLNSCTKADLNGLVAEDSNGPVEVSISLTGVDFTINPATVPEASTSGQTRASDATPTQAGITHISLVVFKTDGTEAASIMQIASEAGDDFNNLSIQLPAGNYTFVAVAHDASDDNIGCATIESQNSVTLPEKYIPTLYSCVKEVTISNDNNQSVTIDMGKRKNATLRLISTDIVPDEVSRMAVEINPSGITLSATNLPQFNPTTGAPLGDYRFARGLPVTAGETIDVSMNLLLPAESYYSQVTVHAQDTSDKNIKDYDRPLENVPFQRAYVTNASGQYFRYVNNSSMIFDITTGTLDFSF